MKLRVVVLAELAVGIGAGRVEVAERHRAYAVGAVVVRQRAFDGELGFAIGVDRARRMIFGDRRLLGIAEHRPVDENTKWRTPVAIIASSTESAPPTLLR